MASKNRNIPAAVGQYDKNACWAACLEWWLKATNLGNTYQDEVFDNYPLLRDGADGTISTAGMIQLIEDPRWYMNRSSFLPASSLTSRKLKKLLKISPVYIGFYDQTAQGNHVNVIYNAWGSGSHAQVSAMEPGAIYDSSDHSFQGKLLTRPLNFYNTIGEIQIGTARNNSSSDYDESYYS